MSLIYDRASLRAMGPQRAFPGDAREAAFLLGGIGTGNVSLGARGELRDWEIWNEPGKGTRLPYSFFAIRAEPEGGPATAKVLESRLTPPYAQSHGFNPGEMAGLPRLDASAMRGEYPFVRVDFTDGQLPVEVSLEAFTPFIPLDADDSGIPGAYLRYRARNTGAAACSVTVAGSLANAVGFGGFDDFGHLRVAGEPMNELRDDGELRGLFFTNPGLPGGHQGCGSMALLTADAAVTAKPCWLESGQFDGVQDFWDDFRADGRLEVPAPAVSGGRFRSDFPRVGSLGIMRTLAPEEETVFEFILAWCFPNRVRGWDRGCCAGKECPTVRNYYGRLFPDAWAAGRYLHRERGRLESASRDFHRAFFGSTLPAHVLDAASANITVIRSNTCFRLEDGTFLAWEGCFDRSGCCFGSCTHVWNYEQTLAFLFPELERSMRRVEFGLETDESGKMAFRATRIFGGEGWDTVPAADGQLGAVVRLYRDWKLSGDESFLRSLWPRAARALDFASSYWDPDGDGVLEAEQHNTYDIEFYGPNPLTNSIYLAALEAGAEMAEYLGDPARAAGYRDIRQRSARGMDELMWNGEYYCQRLDDVDRHRYQFGTGCLSDQLFGQLLAHVAGLGHLLPRERVGRAVWAVFEHNFRAGFAGHHNVQRTYVLNDEAGLLLCSWPRGGRPRLPLVYSDEVWTGIEYQVAAHLIYEGMVDEGLAVVKAVRDRHDGYRRNPWNEVECGHHYARSLASWAVLLALSGFRFDLTEGEVGFSPAFNQDDFSVFWSAGKAWGIYRQRKDEAGRCRRELEVLYGDPESVRLAEV